MKKANEKCSKTFFFRYNSDGRQTEGQSVCVALESGYFEGKIRWEKCSSLSQHSPPPPRRIFHRSNANFCRRS